MGAQEMFLIAGIALLLFGGKKLPELMRGLGKGMREFKEASSGVREEIENTINSKPSPRVTQPKVETETKIEEEPENKGDSADGAEPKKDATPEHSMHPGH